MAFTLYSSYSPEGSQPHAIERLSEGVGEGLAKQTMLGVTGSGKTFTMANIIATVNKPTLVVAHNKTLAAQLYNEFKEFFPDNRVEYFISYYDYYQPESYIPQRDLYIEKDAQINPKIEQMRLSATASVLSRSDTIVVASVSCIYGLGDPENFRGLGFELQRGAHIKRDQLLSDLVSLQYERNDTELQPGRFRVKGDTIDIIPGHRQDILRIELFGDEIDRIRELDKTTMKVNEEMDYVYVFPARHFVIPEEDKERALASIQAELDEVLPQLGAFEAHRLKQRTQYDMEMIRETGYCKGIENYSRHFDNRERGVPPYTLLDYFPRDFLMFIDESHQTIPQLHGMYRGDYSRKKALVEYGFRLPSSFDNRPLTFDEFARYMNQTIFVSATPGPYEEKHSERLVEQIIRPTGLLDPVVEVRPVEGQVEDLYASIQETVEKGYRVLVTTLTKKLAEEMSDYLAGRGVRTRYLHSEIDTLQRSELLKKLRLGFFDVLVGINLLREGLDLPEVGLIGVLDADKEGFLRDYRSLIQIIGRAARNVDSRVLLYAQHETESIRRAIEETNRRRAIQMEHNEKHGITPQTIQKPVKHKEVSESDDVRSVPKSDIPNLIIEIEQKMQQAAENLEFERAIELRDQLNELKNQQ